MSYSPSIVIPTWNGEEHIDDCLSAVLQQSCGNFDVTVVDNGSTDRTTKIVTSEYPQVDLFRNRNNLGFSAACNQGIDATTGDPVVVLNQDTHVDANWLEAIVAGIEEDRRIGIAGCLARFPSGLIQHAGGVLDDQGNGTHLEDAPDGRESTDCEYVSGASLAVTRRTLAEIGGFDEEFYPAYFEDVDLCLRTRTKGYRVVLVPGSTLVHKQESAFARDSSFGSNHLFHKNRLRLVFKNWDTNRIRGSFLEAETKWLKELGEGSEIVISAVHHAYFCTIKALPSIIKLRTEIHEDSEQDTSVLRNILMSLRSIVPLGSARLGHIVGNSLDGAAHGKYWNKTLLP